MQAGRQAFSLRTDEIYLSFFLSFVAGEGVEAMHSIAAVQNKRANERTNE